MSRITATIVALGLGISGLVWYFVDDAPRRALAREQQEVYRIAYGPKGVEVQPSSSYTESFGLR